MTMEARKLLEKALTLPPVERAELVEQILSSFEFPARGEIDALWASEAEGRIDAYTIQDVGTLWTRSATGENL